MFRFFFSSILLASLSITPKITLAERADKDKPIALSSEKASFDDVKQIYILENSWHAPGAKQPFIARPPSMEELPSLSLLSPIAFHAAVLAYEEELKNA